MTVSKPPAQWNVTDGSRAMDELGLLVDVFHRTEAPVFGNGTADPDLTTVRIALTSADRGGDGRRCPSPGGRCRLGSGSL